MRSRVARAAAQATSRRIAGMSPAERIAIAVRLAEEGVASYILTHGVDRTTATDVSRRRTAWDDAPPGPPPMNVEPVRQILESVGAPFCLIGGHALAARGYPRFTVDIDLLTTDPRVLDQELWRPLANAGASVDARRGNHDDPLAGVVHLLLADATDIDVVVGRWQWEAAVVARAEPLVVAAGVTLPVPTASDLILLKLAAGGFLDLRDVAALLEIGDRDVLVNEVEAHLDDVHPDVRVVWRQVLEAG